MKENFQIHIWLGLLLCLLGMSCSDDTPAKGNEPGNGNTELEVNEGDAVTITMDAVAAATAPEITEEMYEQLDYLEKHPEENYYENEENFSQYDQGD